MVDVEVTVNGSRRAVTVPARTTVADVLRDHLGLTGTHLGCEHGVCGACTVLLDGVSARSCLVYAGQIEGSDIRTVEGLLDAGGGLGRVQEAFRQEFALQCGFCTPGILITVTELLAEDPNPDEEAIRVALSGNLCRCTGYDTIVAAVVRAAASKGTP